MTEMIHEIDGVIRTEIVTLDVNDDGLIVAYAEIIVSSGTAYDDVADAYLQKVSRFLSSADGFSFVSAIIDDEVTAVDYVFDFDDDAWRVTVLTIINESRSAP